MIPTNNPFRTPGKFEQFTASFMSENDKKPLLSWFDKFEKILAKSGTNYQKSKIDPTDMLELYYDGKSPEDAAKSLGEELQLEWKKTDGDSRRVSGGDKRRTENKTTQPNTEVDEAESVPLVRTGQGDFKKDTHPKRKDGKVERMYQAKDKNEYAMLIMSADTGKKGNAYSVKGSEKNKTVTVVFDNDKQRAAYEKRMKIKESASDIVSEEEQNLLDFINKNW